MIAQVQKPIEEILDVLDGKEKLVLYRCGGCAWELIYNRLKQLGEMDKWREAKLVIKDYSKMTRPGKIEVATLVL